MKKYSFSNKAFLLIRIIQNAVWTSSNLLGFFYNPQYKEALIICITIIECEQVIG